MPVISFSEVEHIPFLLNGRKQQTTRKPWKRPLHVYDNLYCYFRLRNKKSCWTCINQSQCIVNMAEVSKTHKCEYHENYFGLAWIIKIQRGVLFCESDLSDLEIWAFDDGFPDFKSANKWFTARHGPTWMEEKLDIIRFSPGWLK